MEANLNRHSKVHKAEGTKLSKQSQGNKAKQRKPIEKLSIHYEKASIKKLSQILQ